MSDRLMFIEEWGKWFPVGWIVEESDGATTRGPVGDGVVMGGKYDGMSAPKAVDPRARITEEQES